MLNMKRVVFFVSLILLFSFVSADVISVNSGGDDELVINPDLFIEGFFNCVPKTCAYYGYNCDNWNDGCGLTINCGACGAGFTCTAGVCTVVAGGGDGGGGGGGGGGAGIVKIIEVVPTEFNIRIAINTNKQEIIKVTNLLSNTLNLNIRQSGLTNLVLIDSPSIEVLPGQTKEMAVTFVAPNEPGIYTGEIYIGSEPILVTMNVKTKLLLFDSNIAVLNKDYKVGTNEELRTKVTLVPLGDPERLDVFLNYTIRDYNDTIYITQSETVLVDKQIDFKKNFDIGALPLGDYVVGLELVYPDGVAPSSAHFEIVEQSPERFFGRLIFFLIILILIVLIIIILLIIRRRREEEKK